MLSFDLPDDLDAAYATGGLFVGTFEDGMRWVIEEGTDLRLGGFVGQEFARAVLDGWRVIWDPSAPAA